ncbi:hypothetical protein SMI01S_00340 [Sphingobacterium mizutaii NBRC 14946 = DSM 11724]|uniref:Uncharacterized protein n=1 Tax=Sphingobacterium mizutaii NBRC 14946 = DSM 11724 TaxID=1220576 RepID=A0ABQ0VXY6_9SPHI|nr:hypothetical protein SMI01S_00340 [Sphingobacterium mizutaii NBRC 14946 = DSM 11724]
MLNANQSTFCVAQSYDTLQYLKSISTKLLSLAELNDVNEKEAHTVCNQSSIWWEEENNV